MKLKMAILGPSASGKSTVGGSISRSKPDITWVEASRDLIEGREYSPEMDFPTARARGFKYFSHTSATDGSDWAAKRILKTYGASEALLVTGIRGIDNLRRLKQEGFFCVFLACDRQTATKRLMHRESLDEEIAQEYLSREEAFYSLTEMANDCHYVLDTTKLGAYAVEAAVVNLCISVAQKSRLPSSAETCTRCANSKNNKWISFNEEGICGICSSYQSGQSRAQDIERLDIVLDEIKTHKAKALLGLSGGKDSTASAYYLMDAKVPFGTFTVDMGYYPIPMIDRAKNAAKNLGVDHQVIDGRLCISEDIRTAYRITAQTYELLERNELSQAEFMEAYEQSRRRYSAKDTTPRSHPRVCVLCRKAVIRSYREIAKRTGAKYVFLGMNEWAHLAQSANAPLPSFDYSGFRRISLPEEEEIVVVHLPYIVGATLSRSWMRLTAKHWELPFGEELVETSGNSCLFAKVTEVPFANMTGFHPDSTRLSREVTVGFMRRAEALRALSLVSPVSWNARELLKYSGVL